MYGDCAEKYTSNYVRKKQNLSWKQLSERLTEYLLFVESLISPNLIIFGGGISKYFDEFKSDDPQEIVIDEVVGQMLTLLAIPVYETLYPLPVIYYCVGAFILFRLFDIFKPYPINYVDNNFKGAWGIMLDDILAGTYSIVILILIFFFFGG